MPRLGILVLLALISCACRGISWPSRLSDQPAPTTLPLDTTAQPVIIPGLDPPPEPIVLPAGFAVNVYAQGLNEPRMLTIGPDGNLYVAERGAGRIIRLPDRNQDGVSWDPETGVLLNGNLLDYKYATILDCGPIDTPFIETELGHGPYGASGIGEATATIIPALLGPAVHNAIGRWADDFPITPDKVLKALGKF